MIYYYTLLQSRAQAFLLERRLKSEGIECELSYMPKAIILDLCNMGVKFEEKVFTKAVSAIRRAAIPGSRLYKEIKYPDRCEYVEVSLDRAR